MKIGPIDLFSKYQTAFIKECETDRKIYIFSYSCLIAGAFYVITGHLSLKGDRVQASAALGSAFWLFMSTLEGALIYHIGRFIKPDQQ